MDPTKWFVKYVPLYTSFHGIIFPKSKYGEKNVTTLNIMEPWSNISD